MTDSEIERWCQENNWTEPRLLEIGVWVAFPPGGVIETPIPVKPQKYQGKPIQELVDIILLVLVTLALVAIAIAISPCFVEAGIDRCRKGD